MSGPGRPPTESDSVLTGHDGPTPASSAAFVHLLARALLVCAVGAGALIGSACTKPAPESGPSRTALGYATMIGWLVSDRPGPPTTEDDLPVVFVETFGIEHDLVVQVEVLGELSERFDVRFVDTLEEATIADEDGAPVRYDGTLIGLGRFDVDSAVVVRGERYRGADDVVAFHFRLLWQGDRWQIEGEPEPVESEWFVSQP